VEKTYKEEEGLEENMKLEKTEEETEHKLEKTE
jgi:hypothetical protein